MEVVIREALYISLMDGERIIRQGTAGIQRGNSVFFYDTTKTTAVGFDKNFVMGAKNLFQVQQVLQEEVISIKVLEEFLREARPPEITPQTWNKIRERLLALKE